MSTVGIEVSSGSAQTAIGGIEQIVSISKPTDDTGEILMGIVKYIFELFQTNSKALPDDIAAKTVNLLTAQSPFFQKRPWFHSPPRSSSQGFQGRLRMSVPPRKNHFITSRSYKAKTESSLFGWNMYITHQ